MSFVSGKLLHFTFIEYVPFFRTFSYYLRSAFEIFGKLVED